MAPTERPITRAFPHSLDPGPAPRWVARASSGFSKARVQSQVPLVEDNSIDGELVLRPLRLCGVDVGGKPVQLAGERRQKIEEEFSELLETLRSEGAGSPSIQVPGALGIATAAVCIGQGATDNGFKESLTRLPTPAEQPWRGKERRKGRKLAEEQLAKKVEELARSNAELEQFAYVASHDLQEPLRMVANYTQLLAEKYRGKLDGQADKYIDYAVDGAVRMQALIQDLLAFSRAGRPENGLKSTDCTGVVKEALKNLRVAIQDSGAVVTCDPLPVVMAHAVQLQQVFQNLIGNAVKFCGTEPPVIQIGAQRKETEWEFSVTDNGIDIAAENAEVIFAIFHRLHSRAEYAGNGIGLAICKKIVDQHGGRIWLEPHTVPGATFKFTWPAIALEPSA